MKYLSVCSGIEAATVAWHPLGWTPVAFSEIEAFPSAVLDYHYPDTPNLGDMERFHEWPESTVDVLIGGTPCQSFSVAGLRRGLDDPRGNLALVYLAIAERYRPEWLVWENVPGVLSANGGRAFGAFLGGLEKLGYGWAYRTLDAQYFGLAQRRRRVFVVASARGWGAAGSVLFEPESLRGDSAPGRESGEEASNPTTQGVALRGRECGGTAELTGDIATALRASQGGGDKPHVAQCLNAGAMGRQDAESGGWSHSVDHAAAGMMIPEVAATITAGAPNGGAGHGARSGHAKDSTLIPQAFDARQSIRRLTPRECERLQGFPDDYTLIPHRNGWAKDGPRYKALGNSMAVPVVRLIGDRLQRVQEAT